MKKLAVLAISILALGACSSRDARALDARQKEGESIYKEVIARAEKIDDCGISAGAELVVEPIDSNNLGLIKKGLRHFNGEIEKAIADYNAPDAEPSKRALQRTNKTSSGDAKYRLSKIGYNEAMNEAVVYELDNTNPELGHGTFIFLVKDGNEWNIDSEIMAQ